MAKAKNKTVENELSVADFLAAVKDNRQREESKTLLSLMEEASGFPPKMWGGSNIGFGSYHYKYESGREGDMCRTGFSPRSKKFSVYIMPGFSEYDDLMKKLGKHKVGKSCLYINKLADVKLEVLKELVQISIKHMAEKYPN